MSGSESILYAGYGANRDLQMMEAIIGDRPKVIGSFAIRDVELCVQRQEQITKQVREGAPAPLSPWQIITRAWGENSGFETYAIRPREGSRVGATLFELTQLQRALVAEWELVEFGWYDRMPVTVQADDGRRLRAETEGFASGQEIDRVVDGENYQTYLSDWGAMLSTAEKARLDYLAQLDK